MTLRGNRCRTSSVCYTAERVWRQRVSRAQRQLPRTHERDSFEDYQDESPTSSQAPLRSRVRAVSIAGGQPPPWVGNAASVAALPPTHATGRVGEGAKRSLAAAEQKGPREGGCLLVNNRPARQRSHSSRVVILVPAQRGARWTIRAQRAPRYLATMLHEPSAVIASSAFPVKGDCPLYLPMSLTRRSRPSSP